MEFNLKAVEIYEKEFTRSKKDKEFYSIQEVNEYLDLIIEDYQKIEKIMERLEELEEENRKLRVKIKIPNEEKFEEKVVSKEEHSKEIISNLSNVENEESNLIEKEIEENQEGSEEVCKVEKTKNLNIENKDDFNENLIESQKEVETLTIEDIAEIRRLLQEEKNAMYERNEARR
ncbi:MULTISPECIES: hypothetical protein [unclassified Gemella]|uniref:hypothetical protein n=1 Tax=unclassified Gemella TaxID=2624949 RepID=UPI0010744271|nr:MULTISPECIES: hypothetical protein [unclassified Gemella]MBF0710089.1 hypothetical protein [Gemella sp. GL1.1]MBF0746168.1 hypothetical protein [Gemella sp. 19428wG2_WT2a]NYS27433.1 hypothetical protein [Gemella sp. GL1]TFU60453.1 hypothetical protein E4T67_00515 [Gemella sp. WT2a]